MSTFKANEVNKGAYNIIVIAVEEEAHVMVKKIWNRQNLLYVLEDLKQVR